MQPVQYLTSHQIDYVRWDQCIANAGNSLPYAYSWYLDIISPGWGALVLRNYEAVMPLTQKRKYGISYLYKPIWAQQLGVFSAEIPGLDLVKQFIQSIPAKFKYVIYTLNEANQADQLISGISVSSRTNHLLPLNSPYELLYRSFNQNVRRNLKTALSQGYFIQSNIAPRSIIDLYQSTAGLRLTEIRDSHYRQMERLMFQSIHHRAGELIGVFNNANQLHAAGFFLRTPNRIINLFPATHPQGREKGAMFYLINYLIEQNAQTGLTLDFEGSTSKSVSQFYRSFGAKPVTYPQIYRNTLPWPFRYLKSRAR
ncbi:MAG: hypothetical protein IPM47_07930 [Sphingobacteriales bacterium]|nr:MAG: hypothetical protein IPM47_07930 [Sphingobacteriales bacterium]